MPFDYARINQFPEWMTVQKESKYDIGGLAAEAQVVTGEQLGNDPLSLE